MDTNLTAGRTTSSERVLHLPTSKGRPSDPRAPLQPIESGYSNQILGIDFMGPIHSNHKGEQIPLSNGRSGWRSRHYHRKKPESRRAHFFSEWVTRYGTPDQIHSSQGSNFESRLFHEPGETSGVKKKHTFTDQAKHDCWDELLPQCMMACLGELHLVAIVCFRKRIKIN